MCCSLFLNYLTAKNSERLDSWTEHKRITISLSVRWLCNESLPPTSRRWSVEGLAYLTFDADVKEDLVEDKNALLAMFELAKVQMFIIFLEFFCISL